ncbi:LysR substrate-binding domain-containing protein [Motiliproteus sp. MSK22-1]|uniref:LysR substrate-binding domain-containing protein n=1 Tax=Motiliproteus sp. MSK22-1 TaxID=1897630 RepID=UPI000977C08A|nr:LysR substrate-binding domain-containing protein [Motiliproteus sp. MSK22-1]OMH32818.1 transcriptional regulator [Motiliproteus sp. MSK22-1]
MSDRLPPLNALRVFRYAAESLSFKSAAESLFVTQAAVSQQIRTLEQNLGVKLFERLNREVALTTAGKQLLPFVTRGFAAFEEGVAGLRDDPEPNLLIITALPSFSSRWLVPRLGKFQAEHASINIHISPSITVETFSGSNIDIAIRYGKGNYPGLRAQFLQHDFLVPVCHPDVVDMNSDVIPQLAAMPLLFDEGQDLDNGWQLFLKKLNLSKEKAVSRLVVTDSTMLVEPILCKQGISLLRYSLVYELLKHGQLICPIPFYYQSGYSYYLVAPDAHFQRPKVALFERWLINEMKEIGQHWSEFRGNGLSLMT